MNNTSILKLATAFMALTISAHAVEIFSVQTQTDQYPTTSVENFTGSSNDIYGTTDTGTQSGTGWGNTISSNFNGASSVINPGDQSTTTGTNPQTTTYFGPTFYAGVTRDAYKGAAGVIHSNGNGYRIRVNNVLTADIGTAQEGTAQVGTAPVAQVGTPAVGEPSDPDYVPASEDYAPAVPASEDYAPASEDFVAATGNGGNDISFKAVFMFDADSTLLGTDEQFVFAEGDVVEALLAVPNNLPSRSSLATYRPLVKANGEYYAGDLYTVDMASLSGTNSSTFTISTDAGATNWTLMPNLESSVNALLGAANGPQNMTVDTSGGATIVTGTTLLGVTQVGFLLETIATDATGNLGGYNYGVRQLSAQASIADSSGEVPEAPDPIEWSEDFAAPVAILDGLGGLSGDTHAYTWSKSGNGLTADPASSVAQDTILGTVVLEVNSQGSGGAARLHMVGSGTDNARRVAPVFHETTFVIDLINNRNAQSDLTLRTRGHDGYVQSVISPTGTIKYSTWMSNYVHTSFDNFSGPSSLRNNTNNPGIVIETGGTFDPASADPVTVTISGNAEGTVVMNAEGTAVESVALTDYGSGYTADPTVTFAGGGMTDEPTVSFNYETGNLTNQNVVTADLGTILPLENGSKNWNILEDGQTLTYIQSYNPIEESISYYFSLDGADPIFITTLTTADSAGGLGFYDFTTGNKWVQPRNQDAIYIQYQRWGTGDITGRVGINSVSVATSDDDGDNVNNRNDAFPDDATETVDSDSDGVGDNADAHDGYDDSVLTPYINTWLTDNNYILNDGTSGGISQEAYDAVVAERDALPTQAAYDAVVAERDALPTAAEIQSTFLDARLGSVGVSVSGGEATISLQVEQSDDDMTTWTAPSEGAADVVIPVSGDATFFRVRAQ